MLGGGCGICSAKQYIPYLNVFSIGGAISQLMMRIVASNGGVVIESIPLYYWKYKQFIVLQV
jgi:predicted ATP-grasp superfamily ATP-dependent carboligase